MSGEKTPSDYNNTGVEIEDFHQGWGDMENTGTEGTGTEKEGEFTGGTGVENEKENTSGWENMDVESVKINDNVDTNREERLTGGENQGGEGIIGRRERNDTYKEDEGNRLQREVYGQYYHGMTEGNDGRQSEGDDGRESEGDDGRESEGDDGRESQIEEAVEKGDF